MISQVFAIVDVETTGGHAGGNKIIEIAIIISDGTKIIEQFSTLINPKILIPSFITGLTGITNEMTENSPTFQEVSQRIIQLLKNKILVAHSVNFDYTFLKKELEEENYKLDVKKICTVKLGRKAFPGLKSYSLGNICAHLGIHNSARHRALGDAMATTELLHKIIKEKGCSTIIQEEKIQKKNLSSFPPQLNLDNIDHIPNKPGIYRFHDQNNRVIYIGKANKIRVRIKTHFGGNDFTKRKQDFNREIHKISWEETGNEMMALLKESGEIKNKWPKYNRALKKPVVKYGIIQYQARDNYIRLAVVKANNNNNILCLRENPEECNEIGRKLIQEHIICPSHVSFSDFLKLNCYGENCCCSNEFDLYNKNIIKGLIALEKIDNDYLILSPGRMSEELAIVHIVNNQSIGLGYAKINSNWLKVSSNLKYRKLYENDLKIVQNFKPLFKVINEYNPNTILSL